MKYVSEVICYRSIENKEMLKMPIPKQYGCLFDFIDLQPL